MRPLVRWLLVFLWLGLIFIFSSTPADDLPSMPTVTWKFWAHRLGHLGEYSVLGILLWRAYTMERPAGLKTVLAIIGAVFLLGAFDEWHQSFTPGRTPQMIDVVFDTICGGVGILGYRLCRRPQRQ